MLILYAPVYILGAGLAFGKKLCEQFAKKLNNFVYARLKRIVGKALAEFRRLFFQFVVQGAQVWCQFQAFFVLLRRDIAHPAIDV